MLAFEPLRVNFLAGLPKGGLYRLGLRLNVDRRIRIGKLGMLDFPAGTHVYVGSAKRNLAPRLARHARRKKKPYWHIDYFRAEAALLGAEIHPLDGPDECALVDRLIRQHGAVRIVPRFGSGDCNCEGHLVWMPELDGITGSTG